MRDFNSWIISGALTYRGTFVSTAAGYDSGGQWLVAAAADLRSRRERRIEAGRGIQID
jgi:hypothetical protein